MGIWKFSLLGLKASFSQKSENFDIDRLYHTWIYHVSTGIKLHNCRITLPEDSEEIKVTSNEQIISFQLEKNSVILEKKGLPFFGSFKLSISFVTKPRLDEVISYVREESEIANSKHCMRKIIIQNKKEYKVHRIRLERLLDFEPSVFKVEELLTNGTGKEIRAIKETSKDNLGRTIRSVLTWETNFAPLERKTFRISYELMEEENIANSIIDLITQANLLFEKATSVKQVFHESLQIAKELHIRLKSESDFANKIGSLCQLFEVPPDPLRKLLNTEEVQKRAREENWRSIKLIEEWLRQENLYDSEIIETWKYIVNVRNKSPPFHKPDKEIISICGYFGQNYPPNYIDFWTCILDKFKKA